MFDQVSRIYKKLWKSLVRPRKYDYSADIIGPSIFDVDEITVTHLRYQLENKTGESLRCSHIIPLSNYEKNIPLPCLIYAHSHGSTRLEGSALLEIAISHNISLFLFDFSGSGKSTGKYVTIGWNEKDDLSCIIHHLKKLPYVSNIGIWGRSMGAVSAIFCGYKETEKNVDALILDSPFDNFLDMARNFMYTKHKIPTFLLDPALLFLQNTLIDEVKIDVAQLNPSDYADKIKIPAYFIVGKNDDLTPPEAVKNIYNKFKGEKKLNIIQGDHRSERPIEIQEEAILFLSNHFRNSQKEAKDIGQIKVVQNSTEKQKNHKKIFDSTCLQRSKTLNNMTKAQLPIDPHVNVKKARNKIFDEIKKPILSNLEYQAIKIPEKIQPDCSEDSLLQENILDATCMQLITVPGQREMLIQYQKSKTVEEENLLLKKNVDHNSSLLPFDYNESQFENPIKLLPTEAPSTLLHFYLDSEENLDTKNLSSIEPENVNNESKIDYSKYDFLKEIRELMKDDFDKNKEEEQKIATDFDTGNKPNFMSPDLKKEEQLMQFESSPANKSSKIPNEEEQKEFTFLNDQNFMSPDVHKKLLKKEENNPTNCVNPGVALNSNQENKDFDKIIFPLDVAKKENIVEEKSSVPYNNFMKLLSDKNDENFDCVFNNLVNIDYAKSTDNKELNKKACSDLHCDQKEETVNPINFDFTFNQNLMNKMKEKENWFVHEEFALPEHNYGCEKKI